MINYLPKYTIFKFAVSDHQNIIFIRCFAFWPLQFSSDHFPTFGLGLINKIIFLVKWVRNPPDQKKIGRKKCSFAKRKPFGKGLMFL